ncbi:MAG: YIP1 family protein [bacterium]|jgi:hypothetical protein|nr:MAG: hypothetical protein DIU52_11055 [bacterium]
MMDDRPLEQASFDQTTREASPDPATAAEAAFPWPPGPRLSTLDALGETIRRSLLEPTRFFRAMPVSSPLGPAVVYYLLLAVAGAGITLFWGTVFASFVAPGSFLAVLLGVGDGDFGARLVGFLLSPLSSLVFLGIAALIVHVGLVIFRGAHNGLGATLRALAYTGATQLFVVVPLIGTFAAMAWWFVLAVIGLREVHGTTTGRALAAILAPAIALFVLGVILAGLAALVTLAA